jgi:hypothetical protein
VLIARALDSQAASRLEPQLAAIVEELQAIRKQGDSVTVYYFHGNFPCDTCRTIERQTKELIDADFGPELARGRIAWKVLNYDEPAGADLARMFKVKDPVVVLARTKAGQPDGWRRLDKVMALVATGDKAGFMAYVRDELKNMLGGGPVDPPQSPAEPKSAPAKPLPDDLPLPKESSSIAKPTQGVRT